MVPVRRYARLLIAFSLMVFQAQLVAASVLGCAHLLDPTLDGKAMSSCAFHNLNEKEIPIEDWEDLFGCAKCALHCAIGTTGPLTSSIDMATAPTRVVLVPSPRRHFYNFTPDRFLKPPIVRLL